MKIPPPKNRAWIYMLFLILVVAGFFLPVPKEEWLGVAAKGLLFLLIVGLGAGLIAGGRELEPRVTPPIEKTVSCLEGPDEEIRSFGDAFVKFYIQLLGIARTSLVATVAGLYLIKKNSPVFEGGVTEETVMPGTEVLEPGGLIDDLTIHGKVELHGHLSPETEFPGLHVPIRSFLGVPLIKGDRVIGALAVGSTTVESFGKADQEFLERTALILIHVMGVCHQGLRQEMMHRIYESAKDLEKNLISCPEEELAVQYFVEGLQKIVAFDRFTLCIRQGENATIRFQQGVSDTIGPGTTFPLDGGLNGWVMKRNTPLVLSDIEEGDYVRPRYYPKENARHGLRAYLGIPIGSGGAAWGCISLESRRPQQYGEKEKESLAYLAVPLASTLERIALKKQATSIKEGEWTAALFR